MSQTLRISFKGSQDSKLDGRLELPDRPPVAHALFAHCFTCSKDYLAATRISRALAERGIATLRFDFTGLGNSKGDFANTNFSSNIADVICAADYLRENYQAPKILSGHSLGGLAVLAAASQVPESLVVATVATPSEPTHVTRHFAEQLSKIEARGETEVEIGDRSFRIKKQFLDDIGRYDMKKIIADLNRALFVFHSPEDSIVAIEHGERIFQYARHPKSFVLLDEADHLLSRREDAEYVADVLAAWAKRFIGEVDNADAPRQSETPGVVVVSEATRGHFAQRIHIGDHSLSADEPHEYGGENTGPNPYDLLLASLGACTSMTIRMYAHRKKLPLRHIEVRLRHEKIYARDCEDCESKEGRIDRIERVIDLQGDLTEAQRATLSEIADKCPVHRTLHAPVQVVTRFAD